MDTLRERLTRELCGEPSFEVFTRQDRKSMQNRRGKVRLLHKPNPAMRELHRRMSKLLKDYCPKMPWATGSRPGLSHQINASRHIKSRYFYLTDLSGAFESVDVLVLSRIVAETILPNRQPSLFEDDIVQVLCEFFCGANGGLAQGAPASPDLFNLYCHTLLDIPLAKLIKPYGMIYSRFTDDITISSSERMITAEIRTQIRQIIEEAGFKINDLKTQRLDIQKGEVVLTGVGLRYDPQSQRNTFFVPRKFVAKVEAGIHNLNQKTPERQKKLLGQISTITSTLVKAVDLGLSPSRRGGGRVLERYQQEISNRI